MSSAGYQPYRQAVGSADGHASPVPLPGLDATSSADASQSLSLSASTAAMPPASTDADDCAVRRVAMPLHPRALGASLKAEASDPSSDPSVRSMANSVHIKVAGSADSSSLLWRHIAIRGPVQRNARGICIRSSYVVYFSYGGPVYLLYAKCGRRKPGDAYYQ